MAGNISNATVNVTINAFDGQSIFVIDGLGKKVNAYDSDTGEFLGDYIASGAGGLATPYSIASSPANDYLLISDSNTNQIIRFNLKDGTHQTFVTNQIPTSNTLNSS